MNIEPDRFFKALADTTRLRMLMLLVTHGELCVCELTHAMNEIQPKISRHLALLRESGLVSDRRRGQWIHYRLNAGLPGWARRVLSATADGAAGTSPFGRDLRALAKVPDRPDKVCCR